MEQLIKKIMIVDDEILVRVGVKSIVDWEKHGYQVVAEAADGEEALPLIGKYQPDIVMTDLVMSPMDGFELITRCKVLYPNVKFVVLSSYNDMDNVKQAMKLGAMDYVFKLKLNEQNIIQILDDLEIEENTSESTNTFQDERILRKNKPEIKQKLLSMILENSYNRMNDIASEMEALSIKVKFDVPYSIFWIGIDNFELDMLSGAINEVNLIKFSMINIMEEFLGKHFVCDVYGFHDGNFIVAILLENSYEELKQRVKESFYQLSDYIRRYIGVSISGSLSNEYTGIEKVGKGFNESKEILKMRLIGGSNYFGVPEILNTKKRTMKIPYEGLIYDIEKIFDNESNKIYDYMEFIFDKIISLGNVNEIDIRESCMELYYGLSKNAKRYSINMSNLYDSHGINLYQVILKADTLTRIKESFYTVVKELMVYLEKEKRQVPRNNIQVAKRYIRNNLKEELSVTTVSEMLGMNGSYFSHLFKKETGMNFVDYVNVARIKKAKELLVTTDYKIYEIAKMVGIESPNYFSILFKKIMGKSPNDIRSYKEDSP